MEILFKQQKKRLSVAAHLDAVADVIQNIVVYRLPDVPDRPLHVSGRNDLMSPRCIFVGGEDADFPPGHFFFVNVHRLQDDRKAIRTERYC